MDKSVFGYDREFNIPAFEYNGGTDLTFGSTFTHGKLVIFWYFVKDSKAIVKHTRIYKPSLFLKHPSLIRMRFKLAKWSLVRELRSLESVKVCLDEALKGLEVCTL